MAPPVASRRVQCEHCPLSFYNRWQLNGHMTYHRNNDKILKKYEEQKERERERMQALLGMNFMRREAEGGLEMAMLEPNHEFWTVYRLYGAAPMEIDFVGQMDFRWAKSKVGRPKKKGTMGTKGGCVDVIDLTLKL